MDGFELVRSIRPNHPHLPCVLVSGFYYNNDDAVQNALTDRLVIGYLSKPFLFDQFKKIIELVLSSLNRHGKNQPPLPRDSERTGSCRSARPASGR